MVPHEPQKPTLLGKIGFCGIKKIFDDEDPFALIIFPDMGGISTFPYGWLLATIGPFPFISPKPKGRRRIASSTLDNVFNFQR